ncbi:MAG: MBL fold metallo-hydrolase [Thermoleophilaceae bacterium]|nr:MBL fold metallo-hydrolase [Thermoleophilaceae bacterium]
MRLIETGVTDVTVGLVRAGNPSVMTLDGTNTWIVAAAGGSWVIDPGPDDPGHLEAVAVAARALGQPRAVLLTHDHLDHSAGLESMAALIDGAPILRHGDDFSDVPLEVEFTPGHAADHLVFHFGDRDRRALFSGDLILGQSSTIVPPGGGTLIAYLDSLAKVAAIAPDIILPGHGEPIHDALAAVEAQREHRLTRERDLLAALGDGLYDREALLDRVWSDVGPELRIAAHVTMQTNLEKLDLEGRLPDDFETEGRKSWQHRAPAQ